ncbi:MAG: stage II sporulation protein M [Synechococcales cyanobacterium RM1_1_8]|nr:stage II sporulation protein M [Synechococcales cyanobacterium RM1_1_8]
MNVKRWIARREPSWKLLDQLLSQAEKQGLKALEPQQVKQLTSLYRSVSADLARAQSRDLGQGLSRQLQQLTLRAYSQIYQKPRHQNWQALFDFYGQELPRIMRETWPYWASATGIFIIGGLIGWWLAWGDPNFVSLMLPESLIRKVRDDGELWMGSILSGTDPTDAVGLMINNTSVAFRTTAGGMLGGLGTVYILFFNGLLIGAAATLVGQNNLAYPFWAFVLPHGSLELPAIFVAGAAGLLIGRALLFPGQYSRTDALKHYGLQAAKLTFAVIPMLVLAGVIEAFFSPSRFIPDPIKYITGCILFVALLAYGSLGLSQAQAPE